MTTKKPFKHPELPAALKKAVAAGLPGGQYRLDGDKVSPVEPDNKGAKGTKEKA
ncbi:hypothetical protein [Alteromonas alba]|uniref:hypothetical protein n=1 Tax=Alteromonas alba TaxID=2079529 RepID=UPI001478B918|nr:hypothetical protein [Alteromonas alba]